MSTTTAAIVPEPTEPVPTTPEPTTPEPTTPEPTPASGPASTPTASGKLLLLDGHSLAYRAFFALPVENFSTSTGQPTNAVYGFTSMLINVLRDEKPSHIVVAFDVSRQSFRTERYAEYKAGRATTPTDFTGQVALVKEVLAALRIPVVEAPGYEADDAIATLTREGREAGLEVLICSGDRDAFQLVGDHTTVLYPIRGVSELSRMTPEAVEARYGVGPQQYRDLAALVGESSDNLPGIAGVGPKTAAKWITTYGGLDGVVAHVDEIKGKAGDGLRAGLADVLRNYELNRLVDDLDLSVKPTDAVWHGWDREQVHQVFDTLQFRVLRERLYQYLEAVEPEAEGGFDLDTAILRTGEVAAVARRVRRRRPGRCRRDRHVRPRRGRPHRGRDRDRGRPRRLVRSGVARPGRRRGDRGMVRRSEAAQGDSRCEAGAAGRGRPWLVAGRSPP